MAKMRMTPTWLAALDWDANGEWNDLQQPGLVLRVRQGRASWFVRYLFRGEARRFRLGAYPDLGLATARKLAAGARGRAAMGDDPQSGKRADREAARQRRIGDTTSRVIKAWMDDPRHGPTALWKDGLAGGTARGFLPHIRRLDRELGPRLLADLGPREVERFVSAPVAAPSRNRALSSIRILLGWARRKGLIEADPTAGLRKEREEERTRVLSDPEIRTLIQGFDASRYGRAVRLLFLTGLRRDEVLGMRWGWLDLDAGVLVIPPEAEKSGRRRGELRRVAISAAAAQILAEARSALFAEGVRSEFVFATQTGARPHPDALKPILYTLRGRRANGLPPSKDKRAKERPAVLADDVTIHDIRRTVANALLNRLQVSPWIVDHVVLGHARPKLLRTYMPTLPLAEAREGLQRWAELLEVINGSEAVGQRPSAEAVMTAVEGSGA